jgi:tRNA threonylcarbamoyladenosine biosynthesis protein TsaE
MSDIVQTTSAACTRRVAAELARLLHAPALLLLEGDLGAGKTTFVQGLVQGLPGGSGVRVQSPTFALARTYATTPPVHHLDLYRLDEEGAAHDLGLLDMAADPEALTCVEWAERAPSLGSGERVLAIRFSDEAREERPLSFRGLSEVAGLGALVRLQAAARQP